MTLIEQLTDYVQAAFTGLWITTHEADEAEREIVQHARQQNWKIAVWDIASGLRVSGGNNGTRPDAGAGDPLAALRALPALADPQGTALLILHNYHRFMNSIEVVQTLFSTLIAGKQQRTFVVILAPVVQIPVEIEKLMVVIEHQLPDREQLHRIARELTSDQPQDLPSGQELERVLDAAAGLTRYEAEGSFALSLTRHNALRPEAIWDLKSQTLKKSNLLTLHRGQERFDSLGGLDSLKDFCKRALTSRRSATVKPRGILLLSPPGCGKSAFCKALGNEVGRPTLILDIGSLMGSLVGQSEANLRQALRTIDAMAPAICMVDELEKALSGVGSQGDSGVSTRLFGNLLTYLSDHESDVFFVATSNDISKLPPELSRAERFDGVFFLDLPVTKEKDHIWAIYRQQYGIAESQARPDDTSWTGAEIKSCCRLAALLDVSLTQAARNVVPVAVTSSESIERLRTWASGRCLSASAPGLFAKEGEIPQAKAGRKVQRGPSAN
jgi:hypothetical protein